MTGNTTRSRYDLLVDVLAARDRLAQDAAAGRLSAVSAHALTKVNELLLKSMQTRSFTRRVCYLTEAVAVLRAEVARRPEQW